MRTQFAAVFSGTRSNNKRLMIVTTVTVTKPKIRTVACERLHAVSGKELLSSPSPLGVFKRRKLFF